MPAHAAVDDPTNAGVYYKLNSVPNGANEKPVERQKGSKGSLVEDPSAELRAGMDTIALHRERRRRASIHSIRHRLLNHDGFEPCLGDRSWRFRAMP